MNTICLRPVEDGDIPLLSAWLHTDYVRQWFHDPEDWLKEIRQRNGEFRFLRHFTAEEKGRPFGFCQYYDCFAAGELWYRVEKPGAVYSIDYLIGEESYLRRGYGKAIIRALIEIMTEREPVQTVIVQPETENIPSCRTLEACGFAFDAERGYYRREITAAGKG